MDRDRRVHYHREFLNTEEAGGHAFVETRIDVWGSSVDGYFTLADCNRTVSIDCSAYNPEGVKNVREKLRRLRTALVAFEAAWEVRVAMLKPEKPETQPEPASA